ncbi:3-hydroxyisobutyryl-CoA hydrolase 1 [Sesamum angolense]|uniref:3-hydroxyisobutyryl-CoA hydrolase n=1 Tax=Sesamum angolense TaxID=2727404 RepID=A0AAE1WPY8_9LAMI|nr:3-hydroxyisobutyryl-CoA hydrolase 1 [Sesamum angolense]
MASTSEETDQVLVEEKSSARIITLNRPKQLNALSAAMVSRLLDLFLACAEDSSIKLIILKGNGRAFSAGADVAAVARNINQGNWKSGADYFAKEFTMNYVMATYNKPQVSFLNGIVMEEAQVLLYMVNSPLLRRIRVVALSSGKDGMRDVLSETKRRISGLTGARLDGAEMFKCGLATHFVQSERLTSLEEALVKADSSDPVVISSVIGEFSQIPNLKDNSAYHKMDIINKCFSRGTIEEIIAALEEEEAAHKDDDWISSTIQSLKKASPTSLKISLRSIREGRQEGIDKCLVREFRMVCHVMRGDVSKDFVEGCRAILLDKDKNPKWVPSKIESVSDQMVDRTSPK